MIVQMNIDVSKEHQVFFIKILSSVSIVAKHFSTDRALFIIGVQINDFGSRLL